MSYLRFAAMIGTSTLVMFALMYLNTYAWEHVFFSETRAYMAILMGSTMAFVMLGYMMGMYQETKVNFAIFAGSILVFALSLWLVRSQATVGQVSWMRAMIPHHSIAIMTSERAQLTDPRVQKLAHEIVEAQEREIAEMRYLIDVLEGQDDSVRPDIYREEPAQVVSLAEALERAQIATLDPSPMDEAEVDKAIPTGPGCRFSYTANGRPVLAVRATNGGAPQGVVKISGGLVPLRATTADTFASVVAGPTVQADGIRMTVLPVPDSEPERVDGARRVEAHMVVQLEQGLTVGYGGFYTCDDGPKAAAPSARLPRQRGAGGVERR